MELDDGGVIAYDILVLLPDLEHVSPDSSPRNVIACNSIEDCRKFFEDVSNDDSPVVVFSNQRDFLVKLK